MTLTRKKLISIILISTFLLVGVLGFSGGVLAQDIQVGVDTMSAEPPYTIGQTVDSYPDPPPDATPTENSIANVVAWILFYIATFFSWFVAILIRAMVEVASYNNFLTNNIVISGWSIIRDVANNFFIVILLVIAVGTILRVPNYNRQLLPKLLVMAVLINFSKTFAGLMIDASQVLTLWFATAIKTASAGGNIILVALGLDKLYAISTKEGFGDDTSWTSGIPGLDPGQAIKSLLMALILSVIACVVIAMITIVLVYRIVMLWFLVILSPLAFLLTTFPKGQQYASMWWSEIAKYLVVAPVMLFFLYLSFFAGSAANTAGTEYVNPSGLDASAAARTANDPNFVGEDNALGLSDFANKPVVLIDFLIIIGLMVGSLVAAQKTGVAGGQWASKGVAGLTKAAKKYSSADLLQNITSKAPGATAKFTGSQALRGALAVPMVRDIPILGRMAGQAVDQRQVRLATTKAKAEQERITARAGALKLDDKNEGELRSMATTGDKYARIAATQAMMKQGMFKDDDEKNRAENINLINNAKRMLPPELVSTFMDNTKKYNPGLAYDTVYRDNAGAFKTDSFVSDVRTGKVKAHEMLGALKPDQLQSLQEALAPDKNNIRGDELQKFLAEHTKEKEETEMYNDLDDSQRAVIYGSVKANTWERDATSGTITENGKKMRERFNKVTNYNNLDASFADNELEDKRTFVANNRAEMAKKMKVVTAKLIDDVGDIFKIDDFKDRGPAFNKLLTERFQESINSVDIGKLNIIDADTASGGKRDRYRDRLKNALSVGATISDSQLNKTNLENNARRRIVAEIYQRSTSKDVEKMRGLKPGTVLFNIAAEEIKENTVKNLTASPDGSIMGTALLERIRAEAGSNPRQAQRADKLKDIT